MEMSLTPFTDGISLARVVEQKKGELSLRERLRCRIRYFSNRTEGTKGLVHWRVDSPGDAPIRGLKAVLSSCGNVADVEWP
jgi:hypothetical protein